jgi:ribosome-associated translation inhibitor RaiA
MQVQPTITGRRIRITQAIDQDVRARLAKLATYVPSIITARVVIELAERHQRAGHQCQVRIVLVLPEGEVVVAHEPSGRPGNRAAAKMRTRKADELDVAHKDMKVAMSDAFAAARRRLQDHGRRQRGDVKRHAPAGPPVTTAGRRLLA